MAKLKTGDRVIYAFNDQRYNALVANVVEGFNRGTGVTGTHITLAYIQQGLKLPTVATGVTKLTEGKKVGFLLDEDLDTVARRVLLDMNETWPHCSLKQVLQVMQLIPFETKTEAAQSQVARLLELLHEPSVREFIKDRSNQSLMLEAVGDGPSDPEPDDVSREQAAMRVRVRPIADYQRFPSDDHAEEQTRLLELLHEPAVREFMHFSDPSAGGLGGHQGSLVPDGGDLGKGTGPARLPSAADLDAHAEEQKVKAATEPSEPELPQIWSDTRAIDLERIVRAHCTNKGYELIEFAGLGHIFWPRMNAEGKWTNTYDMVIKFPSANVTVFPLGPVDEFPGIDEIASVEAGIEEAAAKPFQPTPSDPPNVGDYLAGRAKLPTAAEVDAMTNEVNATESESAPSN